MTNKENRFTNLTNHKIKPEHLAIVGASDHMMLISNYIWYGRNEAEIDAWGREHLPGFYRAGMILFFGTEAEKTMFMLKWGND
jgi:hypothetical protein